MTAQGAKETKIFVIENGKVVGPNLFDFVMISTKETTSPVGVMPKLHLRHEDYGCRYNLLNRVRNDQGLFEIWYWGVNGNHPSFVTEFETEEEGFDFIFQQTYEFDFLTDDQRNTMYYETYEEAYEEYIVVLACNKNTSIEVIKRCLSFCEYCEQAQAARNLKAKAEYDERIDKLSDIYAALIEPIPEGYKQTCGRLQLAMGGERIETSVFHAAVKKIRNRK